MKYLSVCSGIEAASVAWHPLGFEPVAFSEIETFPCKVLAHHYPDVPNYGDMTKFKEWPDENIDVLVGGTPCQSFSIAGLRKGLDDPRGNLMLTYLAIADKYSPRYIVWENVPGVLSINGGRDFGTFLDGLGKLGYGFAYRVLDAQFCRTDGHPYAVPQRRRRVFVVGCLGDWRGAASVLFDSESLRGNPPPRREAGQSVTHTTASCLTSSGRGVSRTGDTRGQDPVVAVVNDRVAPTINAAFGSKLGLDNQHIDSGAGLFVYDEQPITFGIPGNWIGRAPENGGNAIEPMLNVAPCQTKTDVHAVAFDCSSLGGGWAPQNVNASEEYASTLNCTNQKAVAHQMHVRRLTPRECARLQGFPDDYLSQVQGASDTAMYKAFGNSMAIPPIQIIGQRIQMVNEIRKKHRIAA